jgi:hypothetical protein
VKGVKISENAFRLAARTFKKKVLEGFPHFESRLNGKKIRMSKRTYSWEYDKPFLRSWVFENIGIELTNYYFVRLHTLGEAKEHHQFLADVFKESLVAHGCYGVMVRRDDYEFFGTLEPLNEWLRPYRTYITLRDGLHKRDMFSLEIDHFCKFQPYIGTYKGKPVVDFDLTYHYVYEPSEFNYSTKEGLQRFLDEIIHDSKRMDSLEKELEDHMYELHPDTEIDLIYYKIFPDSKPFRFFLYKDLNRYSVHGIKRREGQSLDELVSLTKKDLSDYIHRNRTRVLLTNS